MLVPKLFVLAIATTAGAMFLAMVSKVESFSTLISLGTIELSSVLKNLSFSLVLQAPKNKIAKHKRITINVIFFNLTTLFIKK